MRALTGLLIFALCFSLVMLSGYNGFVLASDTEQWKERKHENIKAYREGFRKTRDGQQGEQLAEPEADTTADSVAADEEVQGSAGAEYGDNLPKGIQKKFDENGEVPGKGLHKGWTQGHGYGRHGKSAEVEEIAETPAADTTEPPAGDTIEAPADDAIETPAEQTVEAPDDVTTETPAEGIAETPDIEDKDVSIPPNEVTDPIIGDKSAVRWDAVSEQNGILYWNDASRGMPQPGKVYAQMLTPLSAEETVQYIDYLVGGLEDSKLIELAASNKFSDATLANLMQGLDPAKGANVLSRLEPARASAILNAKLGYIIPSPNAISADKVAVIFASDNMSYETAAMVLNEVKKTSPENSASILTALETISPNKTSWIRTEMSILAGAEYKPGELMVKFNVGVDSEAIAATLKSIGAQIKTDFNAKGLERWYLISFSETASVKNTMGLLQQTKLVEYAEPNFIVSLDDEIGATKAA